MEENISLSTFYDFAIYIYIYSSKMSFVLPLFYPLPLSPPTPVCLF